MSRVRNRFKQRFFRLREINNKTVPERKTSVWPLGTSQENFASENGCYTVVEVFADFVNPIPGVRPRLRGLFRGDVSLPGF